MKRLIPILLLAFSFSFAQEEVAGTVTNSFSILQETFTVRGTSVQALVTIVVTYPDNLAEDQYVDFVQAASDVQSFLRGYPNRQAPLEAFASYALRELMTKYPQLTGGSVILSNNNLGVQVEATRVAPKVTQPQRSEILEKLRRAQPVQKS